jgi:hypothetical protein
VSAYRWPGPCPFDRCAAVVTPVPSGDVTAVPGHEFVGEGLTGLCPTSFQRLPLDPRVVEHLAKTAESIDRRTAEAGPRKPPHENGEHVLAPHPTGDSTWFEPERNGVVPGLGRPALRLVQDDEPTAGRPPGALPQRIPLQFLPGSPVKGGGVPSVAETQGRILEANAKIAEAMEVLRHVIGLFGEGQALIDQIRATTSADLGGPAVAEAIEQCEQAFVRGHVAIEANETYGASL